MANVNVGPALITVGGKSYTLSPPDAEMMSSVFDYIIKEGRNVNRSFDNVIEQCKKHKDLPEALAKAAIEVSLKLDAQAMKEEGNEEPSIPMKALLQSDVCARLFHLMAHKYHPEMTYEECHEIVKKEGSILCIAKISAAFPDDTEKKFQASSNSSGPGTDSTGPELATKSSKPPGDKSPSGK